MQTLTIDKTKEWTTEDYFMLGEISMPCQLINGELIMSPAPKPLHQIISSLLNDFLKKAARKEEGLVLYAPVDVVIDQKNVFQPDLLFLSKERKRHLTDRGIEGPPDLIVEILSPSNSYTDRYEKKDAYQHFGVLEYWLVDPANQTLEVYHGQNWQKPILYLAEEGQVSSQVLATLDFDLKEIFTLD